MEPRLVRPLCCLVDTDIAIDFLRQREYAKELLERWAKEGFLSVSTITHLEIHQGMRPGEEEATNTFLDGLVAIPVDVDIARRAGALLGQMRRDGRTTSIADAIIAATALALGLPLLTSNVEHYAFSGLKVIKGVER